MKNDGRLLRLVEVARRLHPGPGLVTKRLQAQLRALQLAEQSYNFRLVAADHDRVFGTDCSASVPLVQTVAQSEIRRLLRSVTWYGRMLNRAEDLGWAIRRLARRLDPRRP